MNGAAHALNRIVAPVRVHAVGQQRHVDIVLGIDPERRAGEAGVTERRARTSTCRTTRWAASCPTRARASCRARPVRRVTNSSSVVRRKTPVPAVEHLQQMTRVRRRRQQRCRTVPRGPAMPPSAAAFSSCTSPTSRRPRHESCSVGAIRACHNAGGLNWISSTIPICASISAKRSAEPDAPVDDEAEQDEAEVAVDRLACAAGTRAASAQIARSNSRRPCSCRKSGRHAGSPEQCASRSRSVTSDRSSPRHSAICADDRIVERQRAALDLLHHERRRRDHLGERREIEDGVVGAGAERRGRTSARRTPRARASGRRRRLR